MTSLETTQDAAGIESRVDKQGDSRHLLPWRKFGARRWTGVFWLVFGLSLDIWLIWSWGFISFR